ncbi:hypothetical protein I4U23_007490 [Adineta vaga]|nr:hypothetical protein I4U23_007490 [Adineta vaga]
MGGHLRKLWFNERKYSHILLDETDEALLPNNYVHKHSFRITNIRLLPRFYQWICSHKCLFFLIIFMGVPILLYLFLLVLSTNQALIPKDFRTNVLRRLLLVVAHPDDECLFFSPTLRVLQSQHDIELNLLVFSRGNHVGLGDIRARELLGSCRVLNIPHERCLSLDLPNIQDNPKVWWSEQQLIPIINKYSHLWSIDLLITFDDQGVSGHINHRAVASAIRQIITRNNNTMIRKAYELKSVSLLRKYSSILDIYVVFMSFIPRFFRSLFSHVIPYNLISPPDASRMLLINTPHDYMVARTAFASHQSQYSWDRHLYMIVSRYMFINELNCIEKGNIV